MEYMDFIVDYVVLYSGVCGLCSGVCELCVCVCGQTGLMFV